MRILVSDPITENGLAVLKNANFDIVELPEILSVQQLHC